MIGKHYIVKLKHPLLDHKPGDLVVMSQWQVLWCRVEREVVNSVTIKYLYLFHEVGDIGTVNLDCRGATERIEQRIENFQKSVETSTKSKVRRDYYKGLITGCKSKIKKIDREAKKVLKLLGAK